MAGSVRYIRKRGNGIYEYHRRVPQSVIDSPDEYERHFRSRPLFRRSLGTRSQADALRVSEKVHEEFEQRIGRTPTSGVLTQEQTLCDRNTRPVTPEIIAKVRERFYHLRIRPWSILKIRAESSPEIQEELDRKAYERGIDAESWRNAVLDNQKSSDPSLPDISEITRRLIEEELLDAPHDSVPFNLVSRAIREGIIAGEREVDRIIDNRASALPLHGSSPPKRAPKLSEVVEAHASQLTKKRTLNELNGALKVFVNLHGDLRMDEIKRGHFIELCQSEASRMVGGRTKGSIQRPLSAATLQKKIGLLRGAINRAIKTDWFEGANPAANIDVDLFVQPTPGHLMPEKRPFHVDEINEILKYPWFTGCLSEQQTHTPGNYRLQDMHFWVPLIALYTGCRAGEIGGLKLSEIRLDDQYPHIMIKNNEFRTTKGSYTRLIPLLDVLLGLGFGDFIEKARHRGDVRLFEDWLAPNNKIDPNATAWSNGALLRTFNRTVIPKCLDDRLVDGVRREVTFHSFRGAFKTMLQRKEWGLPTNYINEVVGHAKDQLDRRYIKQIPISETYPAMHGCNYNGILLPSLP